MSFNICSLSGVPVESPVVSKKTGHIFERRLIAKQIAATGQCPITQQPMTLDDLLEVRSDNQSTLKPREVNLTSVPGMLTDLQSDWDQLLTETARLKREYEQTRQELAHSLYQKDASTRVIANLLKERDSARHDLVNYQNEFGSFDEVAGYMEDEFTNMGINQTLVNKVTDLSFQLSSSRKQKTHCDITPELISQFKCINSFSPFDGSDSISCSDVNRSRQFIAGSSSGDISICPWPLDGNSDSTKLKVHKRRINEVKFCPGEVLNGFASCSEDATASFYLSTGPKYVERYRVSGIHNDSITSMAFHPLQEYAIFVSLDAHWSFHNLVKGVAIHKEACNTGMNTIRFHPDGGLFATGGQDGVVKLWDLTTQEEVTKLFDGGVSSLSSLAFSENGYYLASCGQDDRVIRLWDIRKNKVVKSFTLGGNQYADKLHFDNSGLFLALSGNFMSVLEVKTMKSLYEDSSDLYSSTNFVGDNDDFIVATTEKEVKVLGK